jgi:hypothetical protein
MAGAATVSVPWRATQNVGTVTSSDRIGYRIALVASMLCTEFCSMRVINVQVCI